VEWSGTRIQFLNAKKGIDQAPDPELHRMINLVANHRRKVPVPRRTIRLLACKSRPVAIATILGHLLRCVYYRNGKCEPCGRCKASWISDVFGVDLRNVKAARLILGEIGWLVVEKSPQLAMNRWGAAVTIQLTWKPERQSPPPDRNLPTGSPPPKKYRELSTRIENQNPALAGRSGACAQLMPTLRRIRSEDLHDAGRTDVLFFEACRNKLVSQSEVNQLRFHAAAAHAIRIGKRNPPGLFATIVRQGLWSFLSAADEDLARRKLVSVTRNQYLELLRKIPESDRCSEPMPARAILNSVLKSLPAVSLRSTG